MNKAVFLDKDGVITIDAGIPENYKTIEFYPGIADFIAGCRQKGYKIFVATNQPVVARGMMTENELQALLSRIPALLKKMNKDAIIDKIYYCPHHPNANVNEYRTNCECRKPKPGMLLKAAKEYNVNLSRSWMIGDRLSDIVAGKLAGCMTIQCLTGMHDEKMIESDLVIPKDIKPDYVVKDILEIKGIIK